MSLFDIARACYYDPGYVWAHYLAPFLVACCALVAAAFVVTCV